MKDEGIFQKFFSKMKKRVFLLLPFLNITWLFSFFFHFLNLFQPLLDVCDLSDDRTLWHTQQNLPWYTTTKREKKLSSYNLLKLVDYMLLNIKKIPLQKNKR